MLISAEERVAYWGYRHENISCRDINDDEDVDLVGLERILYGVGFLAVTDMRGVSTYDDEPEAFFGDEPGDECYSSEEYEAVDSGLDPFEYEAPDTDEIQPAYPSIEEGVDPFADFFSSESHQSPEEEDIFEDAGAEGEYEQPDNVVLERAVLRPAA